MTTTDTEYNSTDDHYGDSDDCGSSVPNTTAPMLQMIESAYQLEKGLPSPQEFHMFDEDLCNKFHRFAAEYAHNIVAALPETIHNSDETAFWVPQKGNNVQELPRDETRSKCGHHSFPDGRPVYNQLGLEMLNTRCQSRPSKRVLKDKTNRIKVKKYPELRVMKQLSKKDNNTGIKVENEKGEIFHLVAFGHTLN
jgi:hypothetical protein